MEGHFNNGLYFQNIYHEINHGMNQSKRTRHKFY